MNSSWRSSRFWLRRPRLTNESAMFLREGGLLDGEVEGAGLDGVEGRGHVGHLVPGLDRDRCHLGHHHVLAGGGLEHLLDRCRQAVGRHVLRLAGEGAQRVGDRPAGQQGHHEGDAHEGDGEQDRRLALVVGVVEGPRGLGLEGGGDRRPHCSVPSPRWCSRPPRGRPRRWWPSRCRPGRRLCCVVGLGEHDLLGDALVRADGAGQHLGLLVHRARRAGPRRSGWGASEVSPVRTGQEDAAHERAPVS